MDGDDVRVPDARQQPAFLDYLARPRGLAKQLQRHLALQGVVPGEIHGAEMALTDLAPQQQRSPPGEDVVLALARRVGRLRGRFAMHRGQCRDDSQFADEPLQVGVGGR